MYVRCRVVGVKNVTTDVRSAATLLTSKTSNLILNSPDWS